MSGDYARVYHSVMEDEKFDGIREDMKLFGSWTMLLVVADMAYPSPAFIPPMISIHAMRVLTEAGLIDRLPGHRYRIHGLAAERERRSASARVGGIASGRSRSIGTTVERPLNDTSRSAGTKSNLAEQSRAEQSTPARAREGLPNLMADDMTFLEQVTGRPWSQAGDRQLDEYDRLIGDYGSKAVRDALQAVSFPAGTKPTARQLIWPALRILEPMGDPKAGVQAERERELADASMKRTRATIESLHYSHTTPDPRCGLCEQPSARPS